LKEIYGLKNLSVDMGIILKWLLINRIRLFGMHSFVSTMG